MTDGVVDPDAACGTNDPGGTAWEEEGISFANSASVQLSFDARMGRYPRSVFVWPPKQGTSAICAGVKVITGTASDSVSMCLHRHRSKGKGRGNPQDSL